MRGWLQPGWSMARCKDPHRYCSEELPMTETIASTCILICTEGIASTCILILELPACLQVLACLTSLKIQYCHHSVVLSAHQLKSLENLELIRCEGLRLADSFQCFSNLRSAQLEGCQELLSATFTSVSAGLGVESHEKWQEGAIPLTHLRTDDSLMTGDYFRTIGSLPSLRSLSFFNISNATHFSEKQDLWFQQLTSLECLTISCCYTLRSLPSSLAAMTSIKKLLLVRLHKLQTLPEDGLPPSLHRLDIDHCTQELRIRVSEDGAYWPKIAHVPYIILDGTVVKNI